MSCRWKYSLNYDVGGHSPQSFVRGEDFHSSTEKFKHKSNSRSVNEWKRSGHLMTLSPWLSLIYHASNSVTQPSCSPYEVRYFPQWGLVIVTLFIKYIHRWWNLNSARALQSHRTCHSSFSLLRHMLQVGLFTSPNLNWYLFKWQCHVSSLVACLCSFLFSLPSSLALEGNLS